MGVKKLQKSIDTVKGDVRELTEAFWALRDEVMTQQAVSAAERQSNGVQPRPAGPSGNLPEKPSGGSRGYIRSSGFYEVPDDKGQARVHRWAMEEHPVEEVLSLPVDDVAKFLAAIGHRQRLAIVLMLLAKQATANEIVSNLSLGTSGAAYHHLNVLQGTGLVRQEQRGIFAIVPERIPSLLTILGGLSGVMESTVEDVTTPDTDGEPAAAPVDAWRTADAAGGIDPA